MGQVSYGYCTSCTGSSTGKRAQKHGKLSGLIQCGSNMTGTNCDLFTNKSSRSYLNHLVHTAAMNNVTIAIRNAQTSRSEWLFLFPAVNSHSLWRLWRKQQEGVRPSRRRGANVVWITRLYLDQAHRSDSWMSGHCTTTDTRNDVRWEATPAPVWFQRSFVHSQTNDQQALTSINNITNHTVW